MPNLRCSETAHNCHARVSRSMSKRCFPQRNVPLYPQKKLTLLLFCYFSCACSATQSREQYKYYSFVVEEEGQTITFTVTPTSGDPDLFISQTIAQPDKDHHTWNSTQYGADTATIENAPVGTYYIAVYAYSDTSYTLTGAARFHYFVSCFCFSLQEHIMGVHLARLSIDKSQLTSLGKCGCYLSKKYLLLLLELAVCANTFDDSNSRVRFAVGSTDLMAQKNTVIPWVLCDVCCSSIET